MSSYARTCPGWNGKKEGWALCVDIGTEDQALRVATPCHCPSPGQNPLSSPPKHQGSYPELALSPSSFESPDVSVSPSLSEASWLWSKVPVVS